MTRETADTLRSHINIPNKSEELFLNLLEGCEPFILPGSIEKHRAELLRLGNKIRSEDLISCLDFFGKLRCQLDSENTRRNKTEFLNTKETLAQAANEINALVDYTLIANPELVLRYRYQLHILQRNILNSAFYEGIKKRVLKELNTYIAHKAGGAYKNQNDFLVATIKKLEGVNVPFQSSGKELTLATNLSSEFAINLTD